MTAQRHFLGFALRPFVILAALLVLGACGPIPPTPYRQAQDGGFGYAQSALDDGSLLVTFDANAETPTETIETYALYRAAELARDEGAERFLLLKKTLVRDEQVWRDYGFYGLRPYAVAGSARYAPPLYGPMPGYLRSTRYQARLLVRFLDEDELPDPLPLGSSLIETRRVIEELQPEIERSPAE